MLSFIDQPLPLAFLSWPPKLTEAPPVTLKSAAFTENATREPAKADSPIFFKVIHIFPLFVVIVIFFIFVNNFI